MRKSIFGTVVVAVTAIALVGCSSAAPTPNSSGDPAPVDVTIGMLAPSLSNAAIYIAQAKGYFADEGINLEVKSFQSGEAQTASIAKGDLDVGTGGPNLGYYNAFAQGVHSKIVADKGYSSKEFNWSQFVTTKAKYDAGLTDMGDVEGLKVTTVAKDGAQPLGLQRTLEAHGLEMSDIQQTILGFPDMTAGLAGGSVDVIFPTEPTLTLLTESGDNVIIGSPVEGYPVQQQSVIYYSENFLKNTDVGDRFMIAYIRGLRDYNDAFIKGVGLDEVKQILLDAKVVKDPAVLDKVNLVGLNPDGYVVEDSIDSDLTYYQGTGQTSKDTKVSDIVDNSFVDNAIKQLGKYDAATATPSAK